MGAGVWRQKQSGGALPGLVGRLVSGIFGFFAFPCPHMNIIAFFGKELKIYSIWVTGTIHP